MTITAKGQPAAADRAFRYRAFRWLWTGETVSLLGTSTSSVLLALVAAVEFSATPFWMGLLTAATWLPWLLIGLPAGAWVDGWDPRRVMICCGLVAALATASVPIGWQLGVLSLAQLLVVALLTGGCNVFFTPAYQRLLPRLVRRGALGSANSALQVSQSTAQLAGPAAGGLIAHAIGAAVGVWTQAAGFLVSAFCLFRIRPDAAGADREATAVPAAPLRQRIADGLRIVGRDRFLRSFMIIGGISNFGLTGYGALLVLLLVNQLGVSEATVGLLGMFSGIGGIAAALVVRRIAGWMGDARALLWVRTLGGPPALLLAFTSAGAGLVWYALSALLVSFFVVGGNVLTVTFRQRYVPGELMGRVVTCSQLVNFGTMPVAGVVAGALGNQLGVRTTIVVMAAIHCAANLGNLICPLRGLTVLPARLSLAQVRADRAN
ncbi:MFS transporter [Nakamurella aerolata]|uniref:MFS transporter n=1 Tax=Nakamurella aerolata TaxID=1656892 RepID=A0A849AB45_9ACTN|nr:MFS transporter [Nakamurella aerolata]NNG37167.1 MFS transporter [Nakamurella aerolata]